MANPVAAKVARVAPVAIVGGGYAGMACAVELASAGIPVDVYEASRVLGGRARAVELDGLHVDNGAHILVGAYRETLKMLEKVGAAGTALKRNPLHLEFPGHVRIDAPTLPAPLHLVWALLAAEGLSWQDKFAAIRFMLSQRAHSFRLSADMSAAVLLAKQPERVRRFLWEPLCLAALNTPVADASAQIFLNVLRDSLAADRAASDLLLPATDFSALFPEPAARFIEAKGGSVLRSTRISFIEKVGAGWTAWSNETNGPYGPYGPYAHLVLAVAPHHLPKLIETFPELAALRQMVDGFAWQPIVTCYLAYPPKTRLPFPMVGMDTAAGGHAQWLFDRGQLCGQPGLLAAVISGDGPHQTLSHDALAQAIHGEIATLLPGLPQPHLIRVIEEKRATFACTPNLQRPPTATALPGLWLAGDYVGGVAGDYPATLEGAVRSGIAAARSILRHPPRHQA